jgi:hypothetical protein
LLDCARVQARLSFPLPRFSEWLSAKTDDGLRHGLVLAPRPAAEP